MWLFAMPILVESRGDNPLSHLKLIALCQGCAYSLCCLLGHVSGALMQTLHACSGAWDAWVWVDERGLGHVCDPIHGHAVLPTPHLH
jgi:hypothetical protein